MSCNEPLEIILKEFYFTFNPLKCSGVGQLRLIVFNAIQV